MDDYISKPVDMELIYKLLEKYSKEKQQDAVLAKLKSNIDDCTSTKMDDRTLYYSIAAEIDRLEKAVKLENYSNIEISSNSIISLCSRNSNIKIKQQAFQLKLLARREEIGEVNKLLDSIKCEFYKGECQR